MSVELVLLGAGGIGLVWGWWLAPFAESRQARTWLAGVASCVLLAAEAVAFGEIAAGLGVGIGLAIGVGTHLVLRHDLRRHAEISR